MNETVFQFLIADGKEHYYLGEGDSASSNLSVSTQRFPEGLLQFIRLGQEDLSKILLSMDETIADLHKNPNPTQMQFLSTGLAMLTAFHSFFIPLAQEWKPKLDELEQNDYRNLKKILPKGTFRKVFEEVTQMQEQANDLICNVLDVDGEQKPVSQRMVEYSHQSDSNKLFKFTTLPMSFELNHGVYAEVLRPTSIHDLVDYSLRQCVLRETKMRVCKHCGKYFAFTRRSSAEYCELTLDGKGRSCKEIGAIQTWEKNKQGDELFKLYRREYKRRFVWTKTGKISSQELYDWGSEARDKKAACERAEITLEEFQEWLRKE